MGPGSCRWQKIRDNRQKSRNSVIPSAIHQRRDPWFINMFTTDEWSLSEARWIQSTPPTLVYHDLFHLWLCIFRGFRPKMYIFRVTYEQRTFNSWIITNSSRTFSFYSHSLYIMCNAGCKNRSVPSPVIGNREVRQIFPPAWIFGTHYPCFR